MNNTKLDSTKRAIWDDFKEAKETYQKVENDLAEGKNVMVVLGAGIVASASYQDTETPSSVAWRLQAQMVAETGVPLPIGVDGLPRFAYLDWKSTDAITRPSDIAVVAVAQGVGERFVIPRSLFQES